MNNIYQITWRRQLSLLSPCLIKTALFVIAYIYFLGLRISHPAYIVLLSVYFILDVLPTLILHVQYLKDGRNKVMFINKDQETIIVQMGSIERRYRFMDIDQVEYHASFGGGSGWYSFGEYRFYKITFNDGYSINISCLMMKSIKYTFEPLLGIRAEPQLRILPVMRLG
ncbi:MAG: hypothetical protein EOP48_04425 [Sphingobacteriales bacterium]|nr:MAG: hypothetical protein EOP48_04425 [Sphingobacteriales bacterium]